MKPTYIEGDAVLYHSDCRDIVDSLPSVSALVSDPPYGMENNTDSTRFSMKDDVDRYEGRGRKNYQEVRNDDKEFDPSLWVLYPKAVLWGSNHYGTSLPVGTTLVWIKKSPSLFGTFLSDAEVAWMKGGHGVYCFYKQFPPPSRMAEYDGKTTHPNQKPIELMKWCLQKLKLKRGDSVLDPYMGSGTIGVACLELGIKYIGVEINEVYFKKAVERVKNFYGGGVLGEMKKILNRRRKK